jgi:Membrane domain of glycerophosphoryl diester phosphodiesterase
MPDLDLRPLSLGEILDRTFTIYRRNFLLFIGIIAIPQLMVLAFNLAQVFFKGTNSRKGPGSVTLPTSGLFFLLAFVAIVVYMIAYLFAHGGTVYAVSDLYLGRPTSIGASLRRMRGHAGTLFGVSLLSGFAIIAGCILLLFPGIYVACRLSTCIPASLLENLGPRDSLERSFTLTKDNAGRSFVIYLLYLSILYGSLLLFAFPFSIAAVLSAKNPGMISTWMALSQFGTSIATILVTPIVTIATTVFYYDLRVRKEAFDIQMMMNPNEAVAPAPNALPSMIS